MAQPGQETQPAPHLAGRDARAYLRGMKNQATVLQIRDPRAVEFAGRLAALRSSTETEAVLLALENEVGRTEGQLTLAERIKPIQDRVMSRPSTGLKADKAFYDDINGDP